MRYKTSIRSHINKAPFNFLLSPLFGKQLPFLCLHSCGSEIHCRNWTTLVKMRIIYWDITQQCAFVGEICHRFKHGRWGILEFLVSFSICAVLLTRCCISTYTEYIGYRTYKRKGKWESERERERERKRRRIYCWVWARRRSSRLMLQRIFWIDIESFSSTCRLGARSALERSQEEQLDTQRVTISV